MTLFLCLGENITPVKSIEDSITTIGESEDDDIEEEDEMEEEETGGDSDIHRSNSITKNCENISKQRSNSVKNPIVLEDILDDDKDDKEE